MQQLFATFCFTKVNQSLVVLSDTFLAKVCVPAKRIQLAGSFSMFRVTLKQILKKILINLLYILAHFLIFYKNFNFFDLLSE